MQGESKLLKEYRLPSTRKGCITPMLTDLASMDIKDVNSSFVSLLPGLVSRKASYSPAAVFTRI